MWGFISNLFSVVFVACLLAASAAFLAPAKTSIAQDFHNLQNSLSAK